MKKRPATRPQAGRPGSRLRSVVWVGCLAALLAGGAALLIRNRGRGPSPSSTAAGPAALPPANELTFNRDIAPLIHRRCAYCHRPGQAAPFPLLTFSEVRKHLPQIAEVTASRFMPPWLPEPGHGEFAESRRLSDVELDTLQRWIANGAKEGNPGDLPATPVWPEGWQLGSPDLVVTAPAAFPLAAGGPDVYRNLVIPLPPGLSNRFVRAVELHPGNPRVVHHAFLDVDETRQSRRIAGTQQPLGFDGMDLPESAVMPGGQLLGWQPGKVPRPSPEGLSWMLKSNMDLVVQLHLHPSGKPEPVQPSVGFYFTDQAPTNMPFRIKLARFDFEIPPGVSNFVVDQSYTLPVDVTLAGILPHVHYLGRDLQAYAELPTGGRRSLLWIRDWDFNWQGDYRYLDPVPLPKGSRIVMRYTYDNSTNNLHNPNRPPKPVRHGLQTTDEMAGLVLQAVARNVPERALLARDYGLYFIRVSIDYYRFLVQSDPSDASARVKLGRALASQGDRAAALEQLVAAVRLNPADDKAHYELGFLLLLENRLEEAYGEFQSVVRLRSDDNQAYGNLGVICMKLGRLDEARGHLEAAVRLNPDDGIARQNLARVTAATAGGRQ